MGSNRPEEKPLMKKATEWYMALAENQQAMDNQTTIEESFEEIRSLGEFNTLDTEGFQKLREATENIESLLESNTELQESLSPENSELLETAKTFIEENEQNYAARTREEENEAANNQEQEETEEENSDE